MVNCPKLWPICTCAAQELCFSVLSLHNMAQKTGRGGRAVKSVCQIQVDALSKTQVWIPLWMFVINFITSMFWIFPLGDLGTHICVVLLTLCPIIVHGIVLGNTSPTATVWIPQLQWEVSLGKGCLYKHTRLVFFI